MRKILYISGTRADYGLMRQTLFAIQKEPSLKIEVAATGMHLMPQFGRTIDEIKKDGFKVHQINAVYKKDDKESMAGFIGECILALLPKVKQIKPDIIVVLGDRAEMLAGAIVGAYLTIPVCHLHGGEITSTIDEIARHAITKLSHIHLPPTQKAAQRIINMGEDNKRVFWVGSPGLDDILNQKLLSKKELCQQLKLAVNKPILLIIQHAVTLEAKEAGQQMKKTMKATLAAAEKIKGQLVVIYPSADAGGRAIIKVIEQYRNNPLVSIYQSLSHRLYASLMKNAQVLIGNSSSGLIEAPSLKTAVVNIGTRQDGREKASNIIDVDYNQKAIEKAISKALSRPFQQKAKRCQNPYQRTKTSQRITKILKELKIDKELLDKKLCL